MMLMRTILPRFHSNPMVVVELLAGILKETQHVYETFHQKRKNICNNNTPTNCICTFVFLLSLVHRG